uniref:Uncharacterized protein n=1 Tax=Panagrolaimus davidi TaxID=227884 RepID=A0A914P5V5_9BILA
MAQRYNFTVPTDRQSTSSAANSSASDTSVLSTSSKRQQPSSSYVSIQHPQGRVNPFKFSLNLVVNVQPLDNNEQPQRLNENVTSAANGVFEDGESRTMSLIDNLKPIPKQPATNVKQSSQQSSLNGSRSDVSAYHLDDNYGPSTSFTGPGTRANVSAAQSDSRSSHDSSKNKTPPNRRYKNKQSLLSFASLNKSRNSSLGTPMNDALPRRLIFDESGENEVFGGESTDSRASQASLKDKKKIQTTGNRLYKNKKSLLSFAALQKPRSKSTGTSLHGFKPFPRPRRLSFNESGENEEVSGGESTDSRASQSSLKDERKIQTTGNRRYETKKSSDDVSEYETTMRSYADKTFPLNKTFRNSLGFDDSFCPRSQTAVYCMIDVQSNDEKLYVKPLELLYEDKKMWKRPVRHPRPP